jgi:hypothetical protein
MTALTQKLSSVISQVKEKQDTLALAAEHAVPSGSLRAGSSG